jgi:hypothetical protein
MDGSSGPETKVQHGIVINTNLHCFVRLICLPIRSILRWLSCFFAERGCPHPTEVQWTLRTAASRRAAISGSFLRLSLFLLGRGIPVRPGTMLRERKPLGALMGCDLMLNSNKNEFSPTKRIYVLAGEVWHGRK